MFTTTYQNNHSSTSFLRRNIRRSTTTINAMTNDRSQLPLRTNHLLNPIPPVRESLSINSNTIKPPATARSRSNTNENISLKSSQQQQHYTYSNPPRELQRKRSLSIRNRVSSAPDEISPRPRLNQPKSSSANGSLTPRENNDNQQTNQPLKNDEQEKSSLNALLKQQQKSNVPKSVQNRRIILLFPRSTPKQQPNPSPIPPNHQQIPLQNNQTPQLTDSFDHNEPEMADTMQLAAILASIQLENESNSNEVLSKQQKTIFDPSKYEYVVGNPADTATYKLSPRTLKPTEDLAARQRFSQYYRSEMRSSANAQIPPLMASIVTENNSTMGGNGTDIEQTFTFKLNSTDKINKQDPLNETAIMQATIDNELVHIYYDATLKRFYDPNTGKYYELTSE